MADSKGKNVDFASQGLNYKPFVFQEFSDAAPAAAQKTAEQRVAMPVEPQEPVAPSFSEEELQAAQKEAEVIGRRKGYEDAKREWDEKTLAHETQLIALLEGLTAQMDAELATQEKQRQNQRADMANIVLMIARKLVANALDSQPIGSVEPMINDCLAMLAGEGKLTILVSAELQQPLVEWLGRVHRQGQVIEVVADPQMQVGDCRIEWPGGKAERSQDALWKEMEKIVERALSSPTKSNEKPEG